MYITEQTATGVPTGVLRLTGRTVYSQYVRFIPLQQFGDISLKTQIAIVCATDLLAVQIGIAMQHNTLEVEYDTLTLPCGIGIESLAIPTCGHLLETASTGCLIVPPRHLYLIVMGQVQTAPVRVIECRTLGIGGLT